MWGVIFGEADSKIYDSIRAWIKQFCTADADITPIAMVTEHGFYPSSCVNRIRITKHEQTSPRGRST